MRQRAYAQWMALPLRIIEERTELGGDDIEALAALVGSWSLVADLALSDLVLWVPTWNDGGHVAVAQVRATTAPTAVPDDCVGEFSPRGRSGPVEQATAFGRPVLSRVAAAPRTEGDGIDAVDALVPRGTEAFPIARGGRVIAVVARHMSAAPRVAGQLEQVYLGAADALLQMVVSGQFPAAFAGEQGSSVPRVGDGLIRLDPQGLVDYASPNAVSALRRLGLATEVTGSSLRELAVRLAHRPGPVDEHLSAIASGRSAGVADIENPAAIVQLTGIPLLRDAVREGALVLLQDVTDLRRRERALLTKDATIREIHHRVKNNLQTVAAMLRLQARRSGSAEAREALAEAELRVAAIAVVHESLSAEGGQAVDFDEVADRIVGLVRELAPGYSPTVPHLVREGSWGPLAADQAIPLAMVLSELAHNAVEHAQASRIVIGLQSDERSGRLRLVVEDDGVGVSDEARTTSSSGLGLGIVETLATSSLGGVFSLGQAVPGSTQPGTRAMVEVERQAP